MAMFLNVNFDTSLIPVSLKNENEKSYDSLRHLKNRERFSYRYPQYHSCHWMFQRMRAS
jgi:hypothetical protein